MAKRKKPGPPKRFDAGTIAVRITRDQAREVRAVRLDLVRLHGSAEDSDAIRWLLDESAALRERKIAAGVP